MDLEAQAVAGFEQRLVGKARFAHAGDGAESFEQVGVERCDLGILMTGLAGVQGEEEKILAIESEFDGVEVGESPDEESSGDEHQ